MGLPAGKESKSYPGGVFPNEAITKYKYVDGAINKKGKRIGRCLDDRLSSTV